MKKMYGPIKIFICYAREDETLLRELEKHLGLLKRHGTIEIWYDREISPGATWEQEINKHLHEAHIILFLVSPDFLHSDYCYSNEMQQAIKRYDLGQVCIIPVILRPVFWREAPFGKIQALPTDAKPVTGREWYSREEAFDDVAEGIRKIVNALLEPSQPRDVEVADPSPPIQKTKISLVHAPVSAKQGRKPLWLLSGLVLVSALIIFLVIFRQIVPTPTLNGDLHRTATTPTDASHAYPGYLPGDGSFSLFDPLSQPEHWNAQQDSNTNGSCSFSGGVLHALELTTDRTFHCHGPSLSDFAFEVQMTIIQGDCGGISFREDPSAHNFYQFDVCFDTKECYLFSVNNNNYRGPLEEGDLSRLMTGFNQSLLLAGVVRGNTIKLFVNQQPIINAQDSTYTQGILDLTARDDNAHKTEVAYTNATVWTF